MCVLPMFTQLVFYTFRVDGQHNLIFFLSHLIITNYSMCHISKRKIYMSVN